MKNLASSRCDCEKNFQAALIEIDGKAQRLPEHRETYLQVKLELSRLRIRHFRTCSVCQQEEAASSQEAA